MSKLHGFKKRLKPTKVWLAKQVAVEKVKIARQVVLERAKADAAFAADVLKAVGDNLPKEIRAACEESVKTAKTKQLVEKWEKTELLDGKTSTDCNAAILIESQAKEIIVGGDTTSELTEVVQMDGGGEMLVKPSDECCDGHCGCADTIHGKKISREKAYEGLGDPSTWESEAEKIKAEFQKKPEIK